MKHKKIHLIAAAALSLSWLGTSAVPAAQAVDSNEIGVVLNGTMATFDVPPRVENDRTLVPMRKVFEMLGATVTWDDSTSTATAVKGTNTITMQFDGLESHNVTVNGNAVQIGVSPLEVPPKIVNDRTLVPLRFVSESLGAKVNFDSALNTAFISSPISYGTPKKLLGSVTQPTLFFNDGSLIQYDFTNGIYSNFQFFDPAAQTLTKLPIQAASFTYMNKKLYYLSNKGDNTVHVYNPYSLQEGAPLSFPMNIYSIGSVSDSLILQKFSSTDSTKAYGVYTWNSQDPVSKIIPIHTPNDGTFTYSFLANPSQGLIFYRKNINNGSLYKTYVINGRTGNYHEYDNPKGLQMYSMSTDGSDLVTEKLASFSGNPMIQDGTLLGWIDNNHVLYYDANGNLAVHNVDTDEFKPLDTNVLFATIVGNYIFYVKLNTDNSRSIYSLTIH